jgi:hypothetical protein
MISAAMSTGCVARASYRVYDPYYSDYHRCDDHVSTFYLQWEGETRRDHRDFDKRDKDEQKDYWTWRHIRSEKEQDKH